MRHALFFVATIFALAACGDATAPTGPDAGTCDCAGLPRRFPAPCRCELDGTVTCDPDVELPDTCTDECFCDLHPPAGE
jgi:hypothetical protein